MALTLDLFGSYFGFDPCLDCDTDFCKPPSAASCCLPTQYNHAWYPFMVVLLCREMQCPRRSPRTPFSEQQAQYLPAVDALPEDKEYPKGSVHVCSKRFTVNSCTTYVPVKIGFTKRLLLDKYAVPTLPFRGETVSK